MKDERIGRRWQKLRSKAQPCPDCYSSRIWLNHSLTRRSAFWVECGDCHWCGKTRPTIRWAIWLWNLDNGKKRAEMLRRIYGGDGE